jgi:hypothetical protein
MNENETNDWEIIETTPSLKVKSKLSNYYCKSRYFVSILHLMYNNGVSAIKLVNQLVWVNYSMYPYLPPKLSLIVSVVVVCIFLMKMEFR